MKPFLFALPVALCLSGAALAEMTPSNPAKTGQNSGLSRPVIQLTGLLAKNMDMLNLDEAQREDVKNWVASMPAHRKALEAETVALRAEMRQAIIDGAPVETREALAAKIGANETRMVMMRSNCTDHWREVLSAEQFAALIELASAK